jgi:hypothetical protein
MEFKDLYNEDLRLAILRTLEEAGGYSMNDSILHAFLDRIGHKHSRDKLRTELQWLADQGLVTLGGIEGVMVGTLTERGADVANARATVPGVKRPSPK